MNQKSTSKKWSPKQCGPNPDAPDENYINLKDGTRFQNFVFPKCEMKRGGRGGISMPDDVPLKGGYRL